MLSESVTSYGYSMETLLVLSESITSYAYSMETLLVLSESVTSYGYSMETLLVLSESVTSYVTVWRPCWCCLRVLRLMLQYGDLVGAV